MIETSYVLQNKSVRGYRNMLSASTLSQLLTDVALNPPMILTTPRIIKSERHYRWVENGYFSNTFQRFITGGGYYELEGEYETVIEG